MSIELKDLYEILKRITKTDLMNLFSLYPDDISVPGYSKFIEYPWSLQLIYGRF